MYPERSYRASPVKDSEIARKGPTEARPFSAGSCPRSYPSSRAASAADPRSRAPCRWSPEPRPWRPWPRRSGHETRCCRPPTSRRARASFPCFWPALPLCPWRRRWEACGSARCRWSPLFEPLYDPETTGSVDGVAHLADGQREEKVLYGELEDAALDTPGVVGRAIIAASDGSMEVRSCVPGELLRELEGVVLRAGLRRGTFGSRIFDEHH